MERNQKDWEHLVDSIGNFLAPSMAKDHPNLPVVKAEGCYYYGTDGKKYLDFTSGSLLKMLDTVTPKSCRLSKTARII